MPAIFAKEHTFRFQSKQAEDREQKKGGNYAVREARTRQSAGCGGGCSNAGQEQPTPHRLDSAAEVHAERV